MKTRNTFVAVAVATALYQLLTVRPIDEAAVRAAILTLAILAVYGGLRLAQLVFRVISAKSHR
jgi:hypothetical protein